MDWMTRFISNNKKKQEEKVLEDNLSNYDDYLVGLSLKDLRILYSKKKTSLSIKKNIRNILSGGLLLFFLTSLVTIIIKGMDLYGLFVSKSLDSNVFYIFEPMTIFVLLFILIFIVAYFIVLVIFYKDTKKLEIQVTLIKSVIEQK